MLMRGHGEKDEEGAGNGGNENPDGDEEKPDNQNAH